MNAFPVSASRLAGERPLAVRPASRYQPSPLPYAGLEELEYPAHDWTAIITTCGRICYQRRKINVSQVFAGQKLA